MCLDCDTKQQAKLKLNFKHGQDDYLLFIFTVDGRNCRRYAWDLRYEHRSTVIQETLLVSLSYLYYISPDLSSHEVVKY